MYGKQWNEVFLYPEVSKAISRTTPQNVGLCHLKLFSKLQNISQHV